MGEPVGEARQGTALQMTPAVYDLQRSTELLYLSPVFFDNHAPDPQRLNYTVARERGDPHGTASRVSRQEYREESPFCGPTVTVERGTDQCPLYYGVLQTSGLLLK